MQRWLLLVGFLACGCTAGGSGFGQQRSSLSVSQGMVISQIYGAGGGASASYHNDYVELFNRGNVAVDIGGWSVQYGSGTGSINLQVNIPAATIVEPGQYFLVRLGSGGSTGATVPADSIGMSAGAFNISGADGKVALVNDSVTLGCGTSSNRCTAASIVDLVGYGDTTEFEGSSAPSPFDAASAIYRGGSGCVDTNDNSGDLSGAAALPRNTMTPPNPCMLDGGSSDQGADLPALPDAGADDQANAADAVAGEDAGTDAGTTGDDAAAPTDARAMADRGPNGSTDLAWTYDRSGAEIDAASPPPVTQPGGGCNTSGSAPGGGFGASLVLLVWLAASRHPCRAGRRRE